MSTVFPHWVASPFSIIDTDALPCAGSSISIVIETPPDLLRKVVKAVMSRWTDSSDGIRVLVDFDSRGLGLTLARDGTVYLEVSKDRCDTSRASYSIIGTPEWAWEFALAGTAFSLCEGFDGGSWCKA